MGLFKKIKSIFGKSVKQNDKYVVGLDKSRRSFADKLNALAARYRQVDSEYFEELEQILITSDVGVQTALNIVDAVINEAKLEQITEPTAINELLVDKMFTAYISDSDLETTIKLAPSGVTVILVVGVNGVGKTTSIAKLVNNFKNQNKKVMVAAGDTFRAGAVEQLQIWCDRLATPLIRGKEGSDPASVIYDGVKRAKEENIDILICDTAGRLQTKTNLMNELSKISRVIKKEVEAGPHEVLLVIDATTGQNGVLQAKAFTNASEVTGIVLTKMDGTAKGGIVLAIRDELKIPVKFIGLGEKIDDLEEFDLEQYLYGLTKGLGGE